MEETRQHFWEWLDEQCKLLAHVKENERAEVFCGIMMELDSGHIGFIDALELIVHSLHHAGLTVQEGMKLVDNAMTSKISVPKILAIFYRTKDHHDEDDLAASEEIVSSSDEENGKEEQKREWWEDMSSSSDESDSEWDGWEDLSLDDDWDYRWSMYDELASDGSRWVIEGHMTELDLEGEERMEMYDDHIFESHYDNYAYYDHPVKVVTKRRHPKPKRVINKEKKQRKLNEKARQRARRCQPSIPSEQGTVIDKASITLVGEDHTPLLELGDWYHYIMPNNANLDYLLSL